MGIRVDAASGVIGILVDALPKNFGSPQPVSPGGRSVWSVVSMCLGLFACVRGRLV